MEEKPQLTQFGETLDKLTANPNLCANLIFPMTGVTVTLHSAGDGQWDMVSRHEVRGVFDVAVVDEESLAFRLRAIQTVERIAAEVRAERAAPKLVSDLEELLAAEAQK